MDIKQFDKLPNYAQDVITSLEGKIRELKRLLNDEDKTNVYIEGSPIFGKEDVKKYLPENTITFDFNREKSWQNFIEANITHDEEGSITVRGGGRIKIIPWAANVVKIKLDED